MSCYRIEREDGDYFSIRHVETDQELGRICAGTFVDRDRGLLDGYIVVNNVDDELVKQTGPHGVSPLVTACRAVAANQEYRGYSELKGAAWNTGPGRLECRLGTLIADTARAYARCVLEACSQVLTPQTRDACAQSLAALGDLFMASQAGCFNATANKDEPYFTNPLSSYPRLNFLHAAVIYGLAALRIRYPDLTDAERQKVLVWVLGWLADLLANYETDCTGTRH
jgi:hypothetical protein